MKRAKEHVPETSPFYDRIRQIIESTRASVARSVNTAQPIG